MKTISELILNGEAQFQQKLAFESENNPSISYSGLLSCVLNVQAILQNNLITTKNCIAVLMPQGLQMTVATLATMNSCICIPINLQSSHNEVAYYIEQFDLKAVVTLEGYDYGVQLKEFIKQNVAVIALQENFINEKAQVNPNSLIQKRPDEVALILQTSGSTSRPKAVALTHQQLMRSAQNVCHSLNLTDHDICLNIMPPFHVGAIADLTLAPLLSGGKIIVTQDSSAAHFWQNVKIYSPTWSQGVPTMLQSIVDSFKETSLKPLNSLRFIRSVSSKLPTHLFQQLSNDMGLMVVEIYGMTEAAGLIASNPLTKIKLGSVGVSAGVKIRIVDLQGNQVKTNKEGQVFIRGENVISSYYQQDELQDHFVGHWFKTGDLGYLDEDGYLFISGRIKEMINRGGEKISPLEIDDLLSQHPDVLEAAAFSLPHKSLGEEVAVAVVCREGAIPDEKKITQYLSEYLASYKIPRKVFFIEQLPRGTGGKLKRHLLLSMVNGELYKQSKDSIKSEFEESIGKIWSSILQVETIANDDDFFDLGGDSLRAMELMLAIEKKLGIDLPVSVLLDAPTLQSFSTYLLSNPKINAKRKGKQQTILPRKIEKKLHQFVDSWSGNRVDESSLVIGLNTIGTLPPLFWSSQNYQEIISFTKTMGTNQPIYCMRSLAKVVRRGKRNYPQLAQRYIKEILEIQPDGPFYFAAYCEGVPLILEIAQQLRAKKHEVGLLAIYENHISKAYDARTALFHCNNGKRSPYGLFNFAQQGLKKLYGPHVSSYQYPWHHGQCFDNENVEQFTNDLKSELQLARNNQCSPMQLPDSSYEKLAPSFYQYSLKIKFPRVVKASEKIIIEVKLTNLSDDIWQKTAISGVTLASQWVNTKGHLKQENTGMVVLERNIAAKETVLFHLSVLSPRQPGLRAVEISLREEGVGWVKQGGKMVFKQWVWVK